MASMTIEQTMCPDEGCGLKVPGMAEALGWLQVGELLFCPYHWPSERRRLHRYAQAIEWYDGNIHLREQALAEHEDRKLHIKAAAKVHGLSRWSPEVKRKLAAENERKAKCEQEIPVLKRNREYEEYKHEQENEARRELAVRPAVAVAADSPVKAPDYPERLAQAADDRTPSWDAVQPWEMPDE
jgi:hypothetical protein